MASMINRAGNVVEPTAASVAYAIMDQGGNLDSNFNAVVSFILINFYVILLSRCLRDNFIVLFDLFVLYFLD